MRTLVVGLLVVVVAAPFCATAQGGGPSAFCHVTDGAFTACPDGHQEWSDITPRFFSASNSYLYADQADLDPNLRTPNSPVDTLMLMYDECRSTKPLGPDEYVRVGFTTVEVEDGIEKLEHYVLHIFGDGTIIFFENGVPHANSEGKIRVSEILLTMFLPSSRSSCRQLELSLMAATRLTRSFGERKRRVILSVG